LTIQALELKLQDPKLSWMQLTMKLCPCEKKNHDFQCREVIRREVGNLKKLLTKYNLSV
jgi:hypothetical protein